MWQIPSPLLVVLCLSFWLHLSSLNLDDIINKRKDKTVDGPPFINGGCHRWVGNLGMVLRFCCIIHQESNLKFFNHSFYLWMQVRADKTVSWNMNVILFCFKKKKHFFTGYVDTVFLILVVFGYSLIITDPFPIFNPNIVTDSLYHVEFCVAPKPHKE